MEPYLCSTYTPSCRRQEELPFFTLYQRNTYLIGRANGRSLGTFKQSTDLDLRFFKFFILCIEMCHGKCPTVYQFSLKECQPLCVHVTHNTSSIRHTQLFKCSNHKQLHVSAVSMFQKSKIGEFYSKTVYYLLLHDILP